MKKRANNSSKNKFGGLNWRRILGVIIIMGTILNVGISLYFSVKPKTPRFTPDIFENEPREGKIGTYVYNHNAVANDSKVMDDLALMVDRVLIDVTWNRVMENDSETPFDWDAYQFYEDFFQNLSERGLEIVVQFDPTRSPPDWLNIDFEMSSYRIITPPAEEEGYQRFEKQLMRYVNQTVQYFKGKEYLVSPIEWCLADEPHTEEWLSVLQTMYDAIKLQDPESLVSVVEHKKELYAAFSGAYDMFTIDPYGSDRDLEEKIRLAYDVTKEEKPVRVIISGMERDNDYYMIRRQMVLSWFLGAYDIWFWSYNSRWHGNVEDKHWYVVLWDEEGPIHTHRATAIIEGRNDIQRFARIEAAKINQSLSNQLRESLKDFEQQAYEQIMKTKFTEANNTLNEAMSLLN